MQLSLVEVEKHEDSVSFVERMKLMLLVPISSEAYIGETERHRWYPSNRTSNTEDVSQLASGENWVVNVIALKTLLKRKINLLVGPRAFRRDPIEPDLQEEDSISTNKIRVSEMKPSGSVFEDEHHTNNLESGVNVMNIGNQPGRDVCSVNEAVNSNFYDLVTNESYLHKVRDDSCLYVRGLMSSTEEPVEFLFRSIENRIQSRDTSLSVKLLSTDLVDAGFRGLIKMNGKYVSVRTSENEINVGIRSKSMQIIGNGISAVFPISLARLRGSGTKVQKTKLHSQYYRRNFDIEFEYHRFYDLMDEEELINYYLDHKWMSLREFFPGIVSVSQPRSLKTNCLKFIELKLSLLFGEAPVSCYDIGSSILFFFRIFGDARVSTLTNKLIEYTEYTLGELCVSPSLVEEFLFLHKTCLFINRMISMDGKFRSENIEYDGNNIFHKGNRFCDWLVDNDAGYRVLWEPRDPKSGLGGIFTYNVRGKVNGVNATTMDLLMLGKEKCGKGMSSFDMSEHAGYTYEGSQLILDGSIGEYLHETLCNLRFEHTENHSPGFNRILSLRRKVLEINQRNLGGFVLPDKLRELVVSILEKNPPLTDEAIPICTFIKDISLIVPIRISSLDKGLVNCINKVLFMFGKTLRRFLKKGTGDIGEVFRAMHEFYARLHYMQSNIHEQMFKSDVHHVIEEENISRLRKIPSRVREGLEQLRLCRRVYNEHQSLLKLMNHAEGSDYRLEEKRVFMQFYNTRKIKEALIHPGGLEREVLKMIGKGVVADDDICNQYKLYLYECIKENARICLGDKYSETMLSINKYFL